MKNWNIYIFSDGSETFKSFQIGKNDWKNHKIVGYFIIEKERLNNSLNMIDFHLFDD